MNRKVTETEYNFIKQLLKQKKGQIKEVLKVIDRSRITIYRVKYSPTYTDYTNITCKPTLNTLTAKVEDESQEIEKMSNDIIDSMDRLRNAINDLVAEMEKKSRRWF